LRVAAEGTFRRPPLASRPERGDKGTPCAPPTRLAVWGPDHESAETARSLFLGEGSAPARPRLGRRGPHTAAAPARPHRPRAPLGHAPHRAPAALPRVRDGSAGAR